MNFRHKRFFGPIGPKKRSLGLTTEVNMSTLATFILCIWKYLSTLMRTAAAFSTKAVIIDFLVVAIDNHNQQQNYSHNNARDF
jgi:hypothetical protein